MSEANAPRKTNVTIGINRTLNTAQYESLAIRVETQDEISWSSIEERDKKIDNIRSLLTKKYMDTQNAVLEELGLQEKRAFLKRPKPEGFDELPK